MDEYEQNDRRKTYEHLKHLAIRWKQRGCADTTIGVLLADENEARGKPLSWTALLTIKHAVMARGVA